MIQITDSELSTIKMRVYNTWDETDVFYFHIEGQKAECGFVMSTQDTQRLINFLQGKDE